MLPLNPDEGAEHMNWNTMIAEALKHGPTHGVIVHRVPKDINITDPQIIECI
jgi:hypothetical protein